MKKLILLVMLFIAVSAQAVELSFKNPVLESGNAKRVGAIYRFSNVTTNIDALVKIVNFNNGASLANIDETGGGLDDAFQPTLHTGRNSDSSIDFEITFVNRGTSTEKTISLNATGADIDGDGRSIKEYIVLSKPKSYSLEDSTRLEVSTISDGIYVISKTTANVRGITVSETKNIVTANYENVSKLTYTIGAKNGSGTERWNSLYFKDVSFSNPKKITLEDNTNTTGETIILTGTLRDFHDYSKFPTKNSDFENDSLEDSSHFSTIKLINNSLINSLPKLKDNGNGIVDDGSNKIIHAITNNSSFNQWFQNVDGINDSISYDLVLQKQGNVYVYDSATNPVGDTSGEYKGFFPLDNKLFGNERNPHNYHFTYNINSQFTYQGGEVFNFSGDDDVWVFIDNKLVIDVGGIHYPVEKNINLDDLPGLKKGNIYNLNFFFAERHQTGSNLKITTSIKLENKPEAEQNSCQKSFPGALSSLENKINLGSASKITGSDTIITKKLNASGSKCNNKPCQKSNTLALAIDLSSFSYGNGKNGKLITKRARTKSITSDKEFKKINFVSNSTLNISNDVTIKVKKKFELASPCTLNINGHVTIYAKDFRIGSGSKININGSLKIISDTVELYSTSDISGQKAQDFVILAKNSLIIGAGTKVKGLFYSDGTIQVPYKSEITGAVTARTFGWNLGYSDVFNYDSGAVDAYCGGGSDEKPILTISDSEVVEGDSGKKDLIFIVNLDKDAGAGVSLKYQVFDGNNTNSKLNANSDDYTKLASKASIRLDGTDRSIEIKIPIKGDILAEGDEQFRIVLSDISGASFGKSTAIGTIIDDDHPTISTCYATTDNYNKMFIYDDLNATDGLSSPRELALIKDGQPIELDGEGGAYRATDRHLYQFLDKDAGTVSLQKINLQNGVVTFVKDIAISHVDAAEFYYDEVTKVEKLYIIEKDKQKLYTIDPSDEWSIKEKHDMGVYLGSLAINPYTKEAYATVEYSENAKRTDARKLYQVNLKTGESTFLFDLPAIDVEGLAFANNGKLYTDNEIDVGGDKHSIFEIDLKNETVIPVAKSGTYNKNGRFHDIETLSCDAGVYQVPPIFEIVEKAITVKEGNENINGTNGIDMNITIKSNRLLHGNEKIEIKAKTKEVTAKKGEDFISFSHAVKEIKTGESEVTFSQPLVIADKIAEKDESFLCQFSITSGEGSFKDNSFEVTINIADDDINTINAWDTDDDADKKIKTKVVNSPFSLRFAKLNPIGNIIDFENLDDNKTIYYRVVKSEVCSEAKPDIAVFTNHINFTQNPIDISIPKVNKAIKSANIQFYWKDQMNKSHVACSGDSFAIRPDRYSLSLPATDIKSGEDFNLTIEAKDAANNTITNYDEPFNVYELNTTETKAYSGCALGTLATVAQTNFVNGVSIMTLNYKDIGKLKFVVSEVNNTITEYAHVDADDGSSINRFITEGTITHKIEPEKIKALFSFKTKNNKNYTYYSADPELMGAIIDANITILNEDNNTVSNFSSSCWADDVSLAIDFNQLDGVTNYPMFKDANGTAMANILTSGKLKYTMNKERFTAGKASREILMNFGRSVKDAKAPIKIKLSSPKASLSSLETNVTIEKTIDFVYARAHAPKVQSIVDKSMQAVVGYEVYIPKTVNKSKYGFSGLAASEDFADWYLLPDDTTFGFPTGFNPFARFTGVSIESFTRNSISLKVTKTPHSNRIFFTPHKYLMYNQFNANAKVDSFQVNFYNKKNTWIGKGKQGVVFDDKASKRGLSKMDW